MAILVDAKQPLKQVGVRIDDHSVIVDQTFGTLDLYWRSEHEASDEDRAAAQLLANVAVSYLSMADERARSRAAQEQLAHQVLHDQLTGLPNRTLMGELIEHALTASGRTGALVAVLFVDLDQFKQINDTHGHQANDDVLQVVAHRMQVAVRATDTVGRISGDEFVISCEGITLADGVPLAAALQALTAVGHRIACHIAQPIELGHTPEPITVTGSIGIAVTTDRPAPAALIHTADQAKAAGRGGVVTLHHP